MPDPIEPKPDCLTRQLCSWPCLLPTFVILLILLWLAWVPQPYESDQIAKAAKVLYMSDNGLLFKPAQPPEFYSDDKFTVYYMLQTVVHLIFKGDVFLELNLAAAVCGALFFAAIATALRIALGLPQWLTGLLAINTPAFLHVFFFGNEVAFAMLFFSAAFLLLTSPTTLRAALAGAAMGLAFHCRPDVVLVGPFLCAWLWIRLPEGPFRRVLHQLAVFGGATAFVTLAHWLLFVRRLPVGFAFEMIFNPKFFGAMLLYPFSPVALLAACLGLVWAVRKKNWSSLVLLLLLVTLAYYARMLVTPKYIACLVIPLWAFAGLGCMKARWFARAVLAVLAAAFWFVSFTPYGFATGWRGAARTFPTDDGPAPTGSYLCFYKLVHEGFFHERYAHELKQTALLFEAMAGRPDATAVGFFNIQSIRYTRAANRPREASKGVDDFAWSRDDVPDQKPCLMIQSSFLRWNTLKDESRDRLKRWFLNGQIRVLAGDPKRPFPDLIELGDHVPAGENRALGSRILFGIDLGRGYGFTPRQRFIAELSATRWLSPPDAAPFKTSGALPAYDDPEFVCFTNDVGAGVIYSSYLPTIYLKETDPRFAAHPQ